MFILIDPLINPSFTSMTRAAFEGHWILIFFLISSGSMTPCSVVEKVLSSTPLTLSQFSIGEPSVEGSSLIIYTVSPLVKGFVSH